MKGACHDPLLPDEARTITRARKHLNRLSSSFDRRRSDEDRRDRVVHPCDFENGLERIDLTAIGVSTYLDIDRAKGDLVVTPVENPRGEENHASTCTEYGQTIANCT
jgi:hypothetical protein